MNKLNQWYNMMHSSMDNLFVGHRKRTSLTPHSKVTEKLSRSTTNLALGEFPTSTHFLGVPDKKCRKLSTASQPVSRSSPRSSVESTPSPSPLVPKKFRNQHHLVAQHHTQSMPDLAEQPQDSSQPTKIKSIKDLVETLIFNLQVLERKVHKLEILNQNLDKINKINQTKLEICQKESQVQREKMRLVEKQVWKCYLCSSNQIELYAEGINIMLLACGHLLCAQCSHQTTLQHCPKCHQPFLIDRPIYL